MYQPNPLADTRWLLRWIKVNSRFDFMEHCGMCTISCKGLSIINNRGGRDNSSAKEPGSGNNGDKDGSEGHGAVWRRKASRVCCGYSLWKVWVGLQSWSDGEMPWWAFTYTSEWAISCSQFHQGRLYCASRWKHSIQSPYDMKIRSTYQIKLEK